MNKFILLILFYPFFGHSQSNKVARTFETLASFQDLKRTMDGLEFENRKRCEKDGEYIGTFWTSSEDCNPTWDALNKPLSMKYDIESIDKRDFQEFEILVGIDLPHYFSLYSSAYNWQNRFAMFNTEINFDFVNGESGRQIAKAHSPLEGDIKIIINIDAWENLNNYERVWLLIHEYGHEAFGMKHGDNKLMYPLIPAKELQNLSAENFGGNLKFFGDSTKVPYALNVLFDALIDFYKDIASNSNKYPNIHEQWNYFIKETNEEIERNAYFFGVKDSKGEIYDSFDSISDN
jgi:hypothetical protein